ncbi:probable metabolite transport protein CsbC isoform X2 [Drosophila albomicans]|uniref:Probable metabolite transport protein CsbC isoform X2 n=1 Tax=Drosophila albomicans TaxID=7291 RepID=A0A6P8WKD1_DROAB|nr:probable metabolite transport protein CsbC isoform X2 [Drosophila albomicans]
MAEKSAAKVNREKAKDGNSSSTAVASSGSHDDAPADFDKAIVASGFGRFNLILLLVTVPATCANVFESTTMSYILPIAECDLHLTLTDKGVLNACAYAGMIISAIPWGYLADTKGRRKVLVYGYLLTCICVLGSALSQSFIMLATFKIFGGLMVNGPSAVLFTYLTEMHGPKYRPSVLMVVGMITSTSTLLLPMLAWDIFSRPWDFLLFGSLDVHSWQIFLFVCALPSLVSGLVLYFMPESPRFLMSQCRNKEALEILKMIYHVNTGKPKDTYPIKSLILEVPSRDAQKGEAIYTIENKSEDKAEPAKRQSRTLMESLRAGMQQMKPMFHKPLLGLALHCYTMQFCILLGMNTIRLWLPQLFASMAEYEAEHANEDYSATMCTILEYSVNKTAETLTNHENACAVPKTISMDMYINNIIVSFCGLVGYSFAGAIIRLIGAKRLLTYGLLVSGVLGIALYWSINSLTTIIISSVFVTVSDVAISSLIGAVVALFPIQLRSLVVAIAMMFGRLGALSGNLLFPVFVQIGCMPPFVMVASVMLLAAVLSYFMPNPKRAAFT